VKIAKAIKIAVITKLTRCIFLFFLNFKNRMIVIIKLITESGIVLQNAKLMSPSGNGRKSLAFRRRLQFDISSCYA